MTVTLKDWNDKALWSKQLEPNLYKCPAVDQPICTPEFNRTAVNCVRIGPKGSVFVQRQGANP